MGFRQQTAWCDEVNFSANHDFFFLLYRNVNELWNNNGLKLVCVIMTAVEILRTVGYENKMQRGLQFRRDFYVSIRWGLP